MDEEDAAGRRRHGRDGGSMRVIPHDKALHLIAGAFVASLPFIVAPSWPLASVVAGVCCAAVAVGREIYNQANGGKFDLADIAWTLAGGAYPISFVLLVR